MGRVSIWCCHPWSRLPDEEIFRKARLSVCAIVAKIHTIDWTVELLKNPILRTGMRANWYGLFGESPRVGFKLETAIAPPSWASALRVPMADNELEYDELDAAAMKMSPGIRELGCSKR